MDEPPVAGLPVLDGGTPIEEATDVLLAAGLGDGLPVVPPTAARLARMLAGVAGPDRCLGPVPPLFGELSARAAGYFAVLAGCRPAELPIVLAAAAACLEPEFNLLGVQTTTGTAAVAVIVHGPQVEALGLNAGSNGLGPGNRANASIGRAVALTLTGVGGARPGVTDMATTGQPGKYTFCVAEAIGPFPGLARRRGCGADAVTVVGVSGTAEVLPQRGGGSVPEILDPVAELLAGAALAAGDPARLAAAEQFLLLPPEVATRLDALGATLPSVQRYLFDRGSAVLAARAGVPDLRVARDPASLEPVVTGGPGIKMLHLPGWIGGTRSVTRPVPAI